MRSLLRHAPALLALAALVACAQGGRRGSPDAHAAREYAGKTLAVILPDSASASLQDSGGLAEALGSAFPGNAAEGPGATLAREFGEAFWSGFAASIDYVAPTRVPDSVPPAPEARRVSLTAPGTYRLPSHDYAAPDSGWLAEHGLRADLILVIGPIQAGIQKEEFNSYKVSGSIKVTRLVLQGWYFIWDYHAGRALANGHFKAKAEYRGSPRGKDWLKVFDAALNEVGEASPFRGPKWYRRE